MRCSRLVKALVICLCMCVACECAAFLWVEKKPLLAQTEEESEVGPLSKGRYGKAYVTIRVYDDNWSGTKVVSAALDGTDIRLRKHSKLFGEKGTLNTRLPPGDYTLRWTVTKPAAKGNRITLSFSKRFHISRHTDRLTVTVNGQRSSVR